MASSTGHAQVVLPSGDAIPSLGLDTWRMAESSRKRDEEIAAIRLGLDLGMIVVDRRCWGVSRWTTPSHRRAKRSRWRRSTRH